MTLQVTLRGGLGAEALWRCRVVEGAVMTMSVPRVWCPELCWRSSSLGQPVVDAEGLVFEADSFEGPRGSLRASNSTLMLGGIRGFGWLWTGHLPRGMQMRMGMATWWRRQGTGRMKPFWGPGAATACWMGWLGWSRSSGRRSLICPILSGLWTERRRRFLRLASFMSKDMWMRLGVLGQEAKFCRDGFQGVHNASVCRVKS